VLRVPRQRLNYFGNARKTATELTQCERQAAVDARPSPTSTRGASYTDSLSTYPLAERNSLLRQRRCAAALAMRRASHTGQRRVDTAVLAIGARVDTTAAAVDTTPRARPRPRRIWQARRADAGLTAQARSQLEKLCSIHTVTLTILGALAHKAKFHSNINGQRF
jgi:hypothetical protein